MKGNSIRRLLGVVIQRPEDRAAIVDGWKASGNPLRLEIEEKASIRNFLRTGEARYVPPIGAFLRRLDACLDAPRGPESEVTP